MQDFLEFIQHNIFLFTAIASLAAFLTTLLNYTVFIKQNRQNKKKQAMKVSSWIEKDKIIVSNASSHPVYEVYTISVSNKNRDGKDSAFRNNSDGNILYPQSFYAVLPRGEYATEGNAFERDMSRRFYSEICFKDHLGQRWVRNKHGILRKVNKHYLDTNYFYSEPRTSDDLIPYK